MQLLLIGKRATRKRQQLKQLHGSLLIWCSLRKM